MTRRRYLGPPIGRRTFLGSTVALGALLSCTKLSIPNSISPNASKPESYEWAVLPAENEGDAYLIVRQDGFGGDAVTDVEWRFQELDHAADQTVLNDPTGEYSEWSTLGAVSGRTKISGLGRRPVAVQIRVQRAGQWSSASTFKRIGSHYFGYNDTIRTIEGCVGEELPPTVYWGTDNAEGEGRQRVPDDTSAIVSGDPDGHFRLMDVDDRKYIVPTGSAIWLGGEDYEILLDDSEATRFTIEILADTAVVASPEWNPGKGSVVEIEQWFDRVGDAQSALEGKTLLKRFGFFDFLALSNNRRKRWHGTDGITDAFKFGAANKAQPPMVQHLHIGSAFRRATKKRNVIIDHLDLVFLQISAAPKRAGSSDWLLEVGEDDNAGDSSLTVTNNRLRSDLIEARYGVNVRGTGDFVRLSGMKLTNLNNLNISANEWMYLTYPTSIYGCDGTISDNLGTHNHADHFNINPSDARACTISLKDNRSREHCGDQNEIHSDAWHMFHIHPLATFRDCDVQGNIWLGGFETYVAPGGFSARLINNVVHHDEGDLSVGTATYDHRYVILTRAGRVTFPAVARAVLDTGLRSRHKTGYAVALNNLSEGDVTIEIPGHTDFVLKPSNRIMYFASGVDWVQEVADASFQGAPYQNTGNTVFDNFTFRDNIIVGLRASVAARFEGIGRKSTPDNAPATDGLHLMNNAWLPLIFDPALDDLNGDGAINRADGLYEGNWSLLFADGLRSRVEGEWGGDPTGIVVGRNIVGSVAPPEVPIDAHDNLELGAVSSRSATDWMKHFSDANSHRWRPLAIDTFAKAIEAVRIKAGTPEAAAHVGPAGPTDDAVGHYNFATKRHNGYPELRVERCFPAQDGTLPAGENIKLEFNFPIRAADLSGMQIREKGANLVNSEVSVSGRTVVFSPVGSLKDGADYEVVVRSGTAANALDGSLSTISINAGEFSFTNSDLARPNILSQQNGENPAIDQRAWFDGSEHTLRASTRFDTVRYANAAPYLGTGPAIFSAEVAKAGGGTAGMEIFYDDGTKKRKTIHINIGNGAVRKSPGGVEGTDYGVIDQTTHWRIWIRIDMTSVSRYYLEINKGGKITNWRQPMLIDKGSPSSPYMAPIYKFGHSTRH